MRALIYTRVSQDTDGTARSVTEQEAECRAWAAREGWTITRVITETGSASRYARSTKARSRWGDVTAAIASGQHDILLTWEASRATRQLTEYAALADLCAAHGVLWGYSGTIHDLATREARFRTGLDALLSQDESARTSERIQRAVRARAAAGRPHGKLPYGYRREYDPASGALLRQVPDEEQAPIVREIYARILAGEPLRGIAHDLDARAVPPPRPPTSRHDRTQTWLTITVRRIALSPTYAGKRTHRGVIVGDATWEALVDQATWEKAGAILTDPARTTRTGDSRARHLLSGIAHCGLCGGPLWRLVNRGRWANYVCGTRGCHKIAIRDTRLDGQVEDLIIALLELHATELTDAASGTDSDDTAAGARRTVRELRDRLAGFVTEATAGRLSPATLAAIEADLDPQIRAAEKQLRAAITPTVLDGFDLTDPRASWERLDIPGKRDLIRGLVTVTVHPLAAELIGTRKHDPERVRVEPLW